jgi:predicted peroxiredoxin
LIGGIMTQPILFYCAHGIDDPARATLPFAAANVAANGGQPAIVICTMDAVWLGTRGGADAIAANGLPALAPLIREFVANGGAMWLCVTCTRPRGIFEAQLAAGACIVGLGRIVEAVVSGAPTVALS